MRKWVAVAAVVALGTGVAIAASSVPTNRHGATAAAQLILGKLQLPPGAARSAADPSAFKLGKPPTHPATPDLVDLHSFWHVPGDPESALRWFTNHAPAGSRQSEGGALGNNGSVISQYIGFTFLRPLRGGAPSETLLVMVAAARGRGTGVRADAQVVWLFRRPVTERIPAGVRVIMISESRPRGAPTGAWTVTDRARIRAVAALVNDLPAAQPGALACPADLGPLVTISFDGAAGPLATAIADGSGCGFVYLRIRGRPQPTLAGGPRLIGRLSSVLGISLR
jgi:hypothetical protein